MCNGLLSVGEAVTFSWKGKYQNDINNLVV